jgi:hypothetical protein
MLRPNVGKMVQRTGQPHYCGLMSGRILGYEEHPNSIDPMRLSTCFTGEFLLFDAAGKMISGNMCYLPATIERSLKAYRIADKEAYRPAKGAQPNQTYHKVRFDEIPSFAVEVWCEPDEDGRPKSPLGYAYVTYNRVPAAANNPVLILAQAAGFIEGPTPQSLPAPESTGIYNPETGEIMETGN